MAFFTGRTGSLQLAGGEIYKIKDWSLTVNMNLLDVTALGDVASKSTPGLISGTGSANASYYHDGTGNSPIALLNKIMVTGAATDSLRALYTFKVGTNQYFEAYAFITSATVTASTDEVTTVAIEFTLDDGLATVVTSGT